MTTPAAAFGGPDDISPADRASPHLRSLVRYFWLVMIVAVVAGGAAYELAKRQSPRYDATASVLLTNSEPVNVLLQRTGLPSGDPERDLNTDVALVKVDAIAEQVKQQLKLPWTTSQLLGEVTAALSGTSDMIRITARDASPKRAAAIANAFASRYVNFRRQNAQASYRVAAVLAQQKIAAFRRSGAHSKLRVAFTTQLQQLETAGELQTGASQVVGRAQAPTSPATPRPKFDAAVGVIAGLLIGSLLAIALGALRKPGRVAAAAASNHTGAEGGALTPAGAPTGSEHSAPRPVGAASLAGAERGQVRWWGR